MAIKLNEYKIKLPIKIDGSIQNAFLHKDYIAISTDRNIIHVLKMYNKKIEGPGLSIDSEMKNPKIIISPTLKYLLAISESKDEIKVWNIKNGIKTFECKTSSAMKHFYTATFGQAENNTEFLIYNPDKFSIEGYDLQDKKTIFFHETKKINPFETTEIIFIDHVNFIIIVGHYFSEMKNSLIAFKMPLMKKDEQTNLKLISNISDYAWEIVMGKDNENNVIIYRDSGDDDYDDDDEKPLLMPNKGFYFISGESGEIFEKIESELLIQGKDKISGDYNIVVVTKKEGFYIISRKSINENPTFYPGRFVSCSLPLIISLDVDDMILVVEVNYC